ncbi:MAG: pseudouridine synthase [Caulobacteraceae bacterium]|nr:pseudouridine synthase [Caulobacteraceae bacterium]
MVHDPLASDEADRGQGAHGEGERIAKVLARAGVASRREVERLIEAGRVAINGRTLATPAVKVAPGDIVTLDGEVVGEAEPTRLFRYHKPVGLLTSHSDPQGRPTVFQHLPPGLPRLISIGRLDFNTEGLLLLTNDGELARALELPTTGLARRYRARARGRITQERLDKLKDGCTVEGVRYGPIEAKIDKAKEGPQGANLWITVTLSEGKNREVRRVLESVGLKVNRLIRLSYGPFALGTLGIGGVEEVGPRVIREQLAEFIDPANLPKGERAQWKPAVPAPVSRAGVEAEARADRRAPQPRSAPGEAGEGREKKTYKPGWAKPKPRRSGSPPAAARRAKPSKRAPASSATRASDARPKGPRPGGGPKRG